MIENLRMLVMVVSEVN